LRCSGRKWDSSRSRVHRTCRIADFGSGSVWITTAILAALSETQTAVARSQELSRSIYIRELDGAISFNEVVACDGFFL
jgi:hypothetical protein